MSKPIQNTSKSKTQSEQDDDMFGAINTIAEQLGTIEKFMARKFDEISAEIYATTEQVDMAEKGIEGKFTEVLSVISLITHHGDGKTAANSGAELDAVVDITEDAANTILDAAGRIKNTINKDMDWSDEATRTSVIESIDNDAEEIFMACSFQDITGQRIRKALDNIRLIEERLGGAIEKLGIKVETNIEDGIQQNTAQNQNDIDALFSNGKTE